MINSPIEKKIFNEQTIYIKRDDLLDRDFSGNKARKFYYFLKNEFPHIQKVRSYGSAQSNAMYSLSVLAKLKGWEFEYHVEHLADYLKENPHGNYAKALENGMQLHVGRSTPQVLLPPKVVDSKTLLIEEGGRQKEAEYGIQILAQEIATWQKAQEIEELNIFLPAGTGTTALFLAKAFVEMESLQTRVLTTPCVGDAKYLKKQFFVLEEKESFHPQIVVPSKKRHFGKLYRDSYNIWLELRDKMGVEFDLLYDPHGWLTLLENPEIFKKPTLYIHQGGLIGNESMLARYQRRYGEDI